MVPHQPITYPQQAMVTAQPQTMFDIVQSDMQAANYLVAPGNIVYLLDQVNKVLYEKTSQGMVAFDLVQREVSQNQNDSQQTLTREDVAQMIADALRQYNPHIPKKERNSNA